MSDEVFRLKKLVEELKRENHSLTSIKKQKDAIEHSLVERVKELNCLYSLSELIEQYSDDFPKVLQGITDILPISWQYPEITCGKIVFEEDEYITHNFEVSTWIQSADIYILGEKSGSVEVYYLKEMPDIFEGPFLKEERLLINIVAGRIGFASERLRAKAQLVAERESLKNMNITLREVLTRVQDEKRAVGDAVQANVNKVVFPLVFSLESGLPLKYRQYTRLIKQNLEEIASPFISELSRSFLNLTAVEIQICNMIRKGLSTKEIAMIRGISPATVSRHREHIRKKLALVSTDVNLATYLETYMQGETGVEPAV